MKPWFTDKSGKSQIWCAGSANRYLFKTGPPTNPTAMCRAALYFHGTQPGRPTAWPSPVVYLDELKRHSLAWGAGARPARARVPERVTPADMDRLRGDTTRMARQLNYKKVLEAIR